MRTWRSLFFGIIAILLLCGQASWDPNNKAPCIQLSNSNESATVECYANTALTPFNLGGGGNVSGLNISAQGVRFAAGDGFGGYIFGTNNQWNIITNEANMCPSGYPCPYFGFYPANTAANQHYVGFYGVTALVGCPSSSSCAYMYAGGWVFYSSNISTSNPTAITWCPTNFTQTIDPAGSLVSYGDPGPFMDIDPNNPAHVLVGTPSTGIFETFNGTSCGSATWTAISTSSIPLGSSNIPAYVIAFDSTSGTQTCHNGSGTCTSKAYVYTNGTTAGVYETVDAGASWALTTSGPSYVRHMRMSGDASHGGGNVWVVDGSQNVWEYRSGTWTQITSGGLSGQIADVAINPNNGDHVIASGGAGMWVSTNGSAASASIAFTKYTFSLNGGDSPWSTVAAIANISFAINGVSFDPVNNDILITAGSQWIWTTTFPSGPFVYTALSSGIQGAVSLANVQVSAQGTPTFGYEDIVGCTYTVATATTPPNSCAIPDSFGGGFIGFLSYFSGLSIAPSTTFMAAKNSQNFNTGFDMSGYSTDGFKTTYLPFNFWNATVASGTAINNNGSGKVRITVPSTTGLTTFSPGQTLSNKSIICVLSAILPVNITNTCWPIIVVDGAHIDLVGSSYSSSMATPGSTYIVYIPAAPLNDWFGGGTVLNVTNDGGLIQVEFPNVDYSISAGWPICITGVVMSGSSVVNGCWVVASSVHSGIGTVDLAGSTFVGGDTYVSGGDATSFMAPGGSIAASTNSNLAMYGGDTTFPYCTANAGAGWSQVNVAGVPLVATTVTNGPYAPGTTSITVASGAVLGSGYGTWIQLNSGRYLNENNSSVSGNTVTLYIPIPLGDTLANGANVYTTGATGGPYSAYFRSHQIAADQVTANTFYWMNAVAGLVKWTNCGSTSIVNNGSGGVLTDAGNNDQLKAVPGQAGHLFYTAGAVGGGEAATHPAGNLLWRTCNGVNSTANSVTFSSVPGFFEPRAVGFGLAALGQNYPAIYVVGWYSPTNNQNTATYGIWRSTNDVNNGATGSCSGGNTWTNLAPITNGFPAGYSTEIVDIEGDTFIYGPYYVLGNSGQFYGVQTP